MKNPPLKITYPHIPSASETQEATMQSIYVDHKDLIDDISFKVKEAARKGDVSVKFQILYKEAATFFALKGYRVGRESKDGMYFISWLNNLTLKEGV